MKHVAPRYLSAPLLWAVASLLVACGGASNEGGSGPISANLFQTTFNCPEWNQSMGLSDAAVCSSGDGIAGNGAWTTHPNLSVDQITAAANNPSGGGGKGFRHWVGDGWNNAGGGITIHFAASAEIWVRYYIRFQSGFAWNVGGKNMKTIYLNYGLDGHSYWGFFDTKIGGHVNVDGTQRNGEVAGNVFSQTHTWDDWQGGTTGDGLWHVLEWHFKMNPLGAVADGVAEGWLDGVQVLSFSNVKFSNANGSRFTFFKMGENHDSPNNAGVDAYVDFDDVAISTIGYIGL